MLEQDIKEKIYKEIARSICKKIKVATLIVFASFIINVVLAITTLSYKLNLRLVLDCLIVAIIISVLVLVSFNDIIKTIKWLKKYNKD